MHIPFLSTSRRRFLAKLGALAAAPAAVAGSPGTADVRPRRLPSPDPEPDWLKRWNALSRHPVTESRDPLVLACLSAAARGASLPLYYHGGRTPGRLRSFSPDLVFRLPHRETTYVSGYCHLRQAPRILRTDRISPA